MRFAVSTDMLNRHAADSARSGQLAGHYAKIEGVKAAAYTIPTDGLESDGTLEWDSTTLVTVHVNAGSPKSGRLAMCPRLAKPTVPRSNEPPAERGRANENHLMSTHLLVRR